MLTANKSMAGGGGLSELHYYEKIPGIKTKHTEFEISDQGSAGNIRAEGQRQSSVNLGPEDVKGTHQNP